MALTALEREAVMELKSQGYSTTEIMGFIASERGGKPSRIAGEVMSTSQPQEGGYIREALKDIPNDFVQAGKGVVEAVKGGFEDVGEARTQEIDGEISKPARFVKSVGGLLGAGAQAVGEIGMGAVKLFTTQKQEDKVGEFIATQAEKVMGTEVAQDLMQRYERLSPEQKAWVEGIMGTAEGVGTVYGVGAGLRLTRNMVRAVERGATKATLYGIKALSDASEALTGINVGGIEGINMAVKLGLDPESLMQRVARISKGKQAKFQERAGVSVGTYLVQRNIFGTPDEIVEQLWKRFNESKDRVDTGLASVKGRFKDAYAREALMELAERETKIGVFGKTTPQQARIMELLKKHNNEGLNLSEMNEVKRLYERNVKLDFVREVNSTGIARANTVDRGLADFIVKKADEGGFSNVKDLNKETMLARQLVDDLGAEYAGKAGNNFLSLSDTIFLAEATTGNVGSIATAIGKKVLGSDRVMSSVAKLMGKNRGDKVDLPSAVNTKKKDPNKLTGYLEFLGRHSEDANFKRGEIPETTKADYDTNIQEGMGGGIRAKETTSLKDLEFFGDNQVASAQSALLSRKVFKGGKWVEDPNQKAVVLDSDLIKESHPDYDPLNPQVLHKDSSAINMDTYAKAIAQDESGIVKLTSGGAGSGKSELIVDQIKKEPSVILDGTLSKFDKDTKTIDMALDAGKKVEIHAVYPDISLAYVFNRLRPRSVPDEAFLQTHAGQRANLPELYAKYKDNENVSWTLYQNSRFGTRGGQMDLDSIEGAIKHQSQVDVGSAMEIGKKLFEIVKDGDMPNMEDYINGYKRLTQRQNSI